MKLQRWIWTIALMVTVTLTGIIYWQLGRIEDRMLAGVRKRVPFGAMTVEIPGGLTRWKDRSKEGWTVVVYRNRALGTFQLATAHGSDASFKNAAMRYFGLHAWPTGATVYRHHGHFYFAKPVPLLENGIYVIRAQGKERVHIYFFTFNDTYYWMELDTWKSMSPYARLFHQSILSLQVGSERAASSHMAAHLSSVCREGYFIFCQPSAFILVLSVSIVLLALLINRAVNRRMGRMPDVQELALLQPLISEAHVGLVTTMLGKKQVLTVAMAVTHEGLTLFRFGKPFLSLGRGDLLKQGIKAGQGIAGRFLEFQVRSDQLAKPRRLALSSKASWIFRLYCTDVDQVLSILS